VVFLGNLKLLLFQLLEYEYSAARSGGGLPPVSVNHGKAEKICPIPSPRRGRHNCSLSLSADNARMKAYVETHYYDGGFKADFFPGCRPKILPPLDVVGLKSTEAELATGDYALELSLFRCDGRLVTWLACYTRGFDLQHGDRGAYCGVGIWLVDAVVVHSSHLIAFLREAAANIAKGNARSPETSGKLQSFISQFADLAWCTPAAQVAASAKVERTSYLLLPDNGKPSFDLAGFDVVWQSMAKMRNVSFSRRVYFLQTSSNLHVKHVEHLAFRDALTYAEHIIHAINDNRGGPPALGQADGLTNVRATVA
jgi:hypothetical protein